MNKNTFVIGFALFAMFFGAGNLIFPPYLGMESGSLWPLGIVFFILVDVVLACLGIYVLNAAGGGDVAFKNVLGSKPALILNTAAILCTGVLIAMPRTAATTYEMAITPSFGESIDLFWFSLIYFAIVFALVIRESKVVDIVGKILTPLLVLGVGLLIVVGIAHPLGSAGEPITEHVVQDGILAGYQAMDIICVIGYSIVLKDSIIDNQMAEKSKGLRLLAAACVIAGVLLAIIYSGLAYLGSQTNTTFGPDLNQAALIVAITEQLLGEAGVIVLGIVVALACLSTTIGLVSATAAFFEHQTNGKLSYKAGVCIIIVFGILICNIGLDAIIALATPVLALVCPPFMTTIVLLLFRNKIKSKLVFQLAALGAFLASIFIAVQQTFGVIPAVEALPLYTYGFAWLPFAILGGVLAYIILMIKQRQN